jgi:tetratricopeptide (TPR) repeat protein
VYPTLFIFVFGIAMPLARTEAAQQVHPEDTYCATRWNELKSQHPGDWSSLRDAWTAQEARCRDTGSYEYHLATIEENLGNVDRAIEILDSALKRHLPYHDPSYVALLELRFRRFVLARPPGLDGARKIAGELEAFSRERPNDSLALMLLANQKLILGDNAGALKEAQAAAKLEPGNPASQRAILIAQTKLGHFAEARAGIEPLLAVHRELTGDAALMFAVSTAFLETGDLESAEGALAVLQRRSPDVSRDPEFQALVQRLLAAKEAAAKPAR